MEENATVPWSFTSFTVDSEVGLAKARAWALAALLRQLLEARFSQEDNNHPSHNNCAATAAPRRTT